MRTIPIFVALVAAILATPASAQCTYRMNDVGRPHGYLSGPCNGYAVGYAGAYPSKQAKPVPSAAGGRPYTATVRKLNGSTVTRIGNKYQAYDSNGRLLGRGVERGGVIYMRSSDGTPVTVNGGRIYTRGRETGIARDLP